MSQEEVLDIKKVVKTETVKVILGTIATLILGLGGFYVATQVWKARMEETVHTQSIDINDVKGDVKIIKQDIAAIKRDPELASAEMKEVRSMLQMVLENQKTDANDIRDLRARQDKFYDEIIDELKRKKK